MKTEETKQLDVKRIIEKIKDNETKRDILGIDIHNLVKEWVISKLLLRGSGYNWTFYIANKEVGEVRIHDEEIYFVQT